MRGVVRDLQLKTSETAAEIKQRRIINMKNLNGNAPTFTFAKDEKKPSKTRGKSWNNIAFEAEADVYKEDLELFSSPPTSSADVSEHIGLCCLRLDRRRNLLPRAFPRR